MNFSKTEVQTYTHTIAKSVQKLCCTKAKRNFFLLFDEKNETNTKKKQQMFSANRACLSVSKRSKESFTHKQS